MKKISVYLWQILTPVIIVVSIDQVSKYLAIENLELGQKTTFRLVPLVSFRLALNTGINFGVFSTGGHVFRYLLIAILSSIGLALLGSAFSASTLQKRVGLAIAAGGAFGNVIDRLTYGAVIDFLSISCCGISNPWSFNVADIAIFFGLGLFLFKRQVDQAL
ncbi:signal peptidase II [Mesorhizobium sp. M0036]|uniref:signal peptidase II n=1 Tax=Mesorhizobium sp. M0036 TaxID=2956853 RepID=UPI003334D8D6